MTDTGNLQDMDIFARVVSAGSMSAAAREMGLSPAVISKRLRRLEERLGTRLLQRTTRQIALTEAGQGFHERIIAILAGVEEAEAFVMRRSSMARGILKVSAPTSFARLHLAPYLGRFIKDNPDVTLQLMLSDAFVDIIGEGYDLALRIGTLDDSSLVARRLAPIHRVLCAAPAYLAEHGTPKTLNCLENHRQLATLSQEVWRLEGPEGTVSFKPHSMIITNSNEVIREATLAGLGISLRSTWDVGPDLVSGKLLRVLDQYQASSTIALHAVYPSRRFLAAKVRVFIDFLSTLYSSQPAWDDGLKRILHPAPAASE